MLFPRHLVVTYTVVFALHECCSTAAPLELEERLTALAGQQIDVKESKKKLIGFTAITYPYYNLISRTGRCILVCSMRILFDFCPCSRGWHCSRRTLLGVDPFCTVFSTHTHTLHCCYWVITESTLSAGYFLHTHTPCYAAGCYCGYRNPTG